MNPYTTLESQYRLSTNRNLHIPQHLMHEGGLSAADSKLQRPPAGLSLRLGGLLLSSDSICHSVSMHAASMVSEDGKS